MGIIIVAGCAVLAGVMAMRGMRFTAAFWVCAAALQAVVVLSSQGRAGHGIVEIAIVVLLVGLLPLAYFALREMRGVARRPR